MEGVVRLMSLGRPGWWTWWVVKWTGASRGNWSTKSIDRPGKSWLVINCCHFRQMPCKCMLLKVFYVHQQLFKTFLKNVLRICIIFIWYNQKWHNQISDENGRRVHIPVKLSNPGCLSSSGDQSMLIGTFIYC